MGILPEDLPRIFEAFAQGGDAASRRFGGLGLGLSISRAIIEVHGGRIWAESAGAGRGTTMHIDLPLAAAEPAPTAQVAPPEAVSSSLRILLVEDDKATLSTLERLLKRRGHEVFAAATVAESRELVKKQKLDLVISDLGLPDGNGYDLMREVHAEHGIPGIALSGFGMEEDIRRSRESGFDDHLIKPIDIAMLDAAISRTCAKGV